jgi:protein TonB
MLDDCLFDSRSSARSKKPATAVSVLVHGTIAAALILIPLFQTPLLPQVPVFEPLQPPAAGGPRVVELVRAAGGPPSGSKSKAIPEPQALLAPIEIPSQIVKVVDEPGSSMVGTFPFPGGGTGSGGPGSVPFGVPFGIPGGNPPPPPPKAPTPPPAPPRPPDPPPAPTSPVLISGGVSQANLVNIVKPIYPRLAIETRTQGAVLLEAVITREGTIDPARLRVLQGHLLLQQAAIDAVKQWRYRPTLLSGVPVEVMTTITVNFTMN